jgi:acyl-CoA synthetase (AMP-forming)/AMP-acid ligase II
MQTFPPFALFDTALGMTTVVPVMDPTRPAEADPETLINAIEQFEVNSLFGSPALLDRLSRHCETTSKRLDSVNRVISAGAAVPVRTIRRLEKSLYDDAVIHTPYGATECLPVSNITNHELDESVEDMIESGEGICVGKPVDANTVRIIKISEIAIDDLDETTSMPPGMAGEIIVSGPSCTDSYWELPEANRMAKVQQDDGTTWHRMGDAGVMDGAGRLWFLGRVSQRINTGSEILFAEQCEAVFNQHPDTARTAVVGVGATGRQIPVLCIELIGKLAPVDLERVHFDLLQLAQAHSLTRSIRTVLIHDGFPVDIRHNSKIDRSELASWATSKMQQ